MSLHQNLSWYMSNPGADDEDPPPDGFQWESTFENGQVHRVAVPILVSSKTREQVEAEKQKAAEESAAKRAASRSKRQRKVVEEVEEDDDDDEVDPADFEEDEERPRRTPRVSTGNRPRRSRKKVNAVRKDVSIVPTGNDADVCGASLGMWAHSILPSMFWKIK